MNVSVVIVVRHLFCFTVFHVVPRGNRILGLEASLRLFSEASHIPFLCCTTPSLCLPPEIWSQLVVERLSISSVSRYVKSQG